VVAGEQVRGQPGMALHDHRGTLGPGGDQDQRREHCTGGDLSGHAQELVAGYPERFDAVADSDRWAERLSGVPSGREPGLRQPSHPR
jgi:hypothetical protein